MSHLSADTIGRPSGQELEGLFAMVTGASRGIGRAIGDKLLNAGAAVCFCGTTDRSLETIRRDFGDDKRVRTRAFDVVNREAAIEAACDLEREVGHIDILVNVAGRYIAKPFLSSSPIDFTRLFEVNLLGAVHLMQALLPGMIGRGFGRIVNIASTGGKWGSVNQSAYNVSKHALVGLTRCVALETATTGVTVNGICPGFVRTDLVGPFCVDHAAINNCSPSIVMERVLARIPIGRLIEPAEIADLAKFLVSRSAGAMTGQTILFDGGMLLV